jgi:hypothetical protein
MKDKKCSKCNKIKPINEFNKHKNHNDGLRSECKNCHYLAQKEYRITHKEQIKQTNAEYKYRRYYTAKGKAETRNKVWAIDREEYEILINSGCYYCSNDLSQELGIGLDRIDNTIKEYSLTNVLPCCKVCNSIRGQYLTVEETKVAVQAVQEYRNLT